MNRKRLIILIAAFCTVSLGFFLYRKVYYKHEGIRYEIRPRDVIKAGDSFDTVNRDTSYSTRHESNV